ncbi:MAG: NAD(P)-dependent alcohol dehydrogenase [Spirochaetia bacterium]
MNAYVLHGVEDLRSEQRGERDLEADEVRVEIARVGICGSDVHYHNHFRIGDFVPQAPLVLGHEFAGKVIEVGSEVKEYKVGDRVTAEPSIACLKCRYCRQGRYNLCTDMRFIGTAATVPHIDGAFAERVVVPARQCYRIPEGLDYAAGALVEPMAVGCHAVTRAGALGGKRVLITGGGTIGQMVLAVARAFGAVDLTVADPAPFAREFSTGQGARTAYDPSVSEDRSAMIDAPFDVVFECSGSPKALELAYAASARGATVVQVGTQPASVELPANLVMSRELSVLGSFRYTHVFDTVLELMSAGKVSVDSLVSAVYSFDDMQSAMTRAVSGSDVIKVQVSREG